MKTKTLAAFFALFAFVALPIFSAETRNEVVKPSANDALPNNPAVPDVYALEGKFERVVVLRFKYDTDLLAGLERMVKEQKIKNAVILSGIGSVRGYHIHQVSNRTLPSKNMFEKDPEAPADIAGMNGYVFDGVLHPHITLANPERAFGGHLEPGTIVFTFAIVTIGVLPDSMDLKRADDKNYR
jgi:predicted DNA-binding protein with PD1-like motif